MAQISRPIQIAFGTIVVLAAIWLLAFQGHKTPAENEPAPAASTPSTSASSGSGSSSGGAGSKEYHGSAPGVAGLTKAINKAHGAVSTSEKNAQQLSQKSAAASGESANSDEASKAAETSKGAAGSTSTKTSAQGTTSAHGTTTAPSASASTPKTSTQPKSPATKTATAGFARQHEVETALHQGKIAVLLFWSPKGADDVSVHKELQALLNAHKHARGGHVAESLTRNFGRELNKGIAVFDASSKEVAAFGSITRGVQVFGTPTLLIVNSKGTTTTLTGLQDAFAIEQAVNITRHA
jgi:hypothetical protein